MWAASAAGAVPIPGTPVPITLQTFVVMLAALMLPWKQAGAAMLMYLAAGAVGLPVFAGGASTMALVGPSAGFLIGFLPAAVVTSLLKGEARTDSLKHGALTAARYLFACVAGCIVLDYLLGFIVQSAITGVALPIVAVASMGFVCRRRRSRPSSPPAVVAGLGEASVGSGTHHPLTHTALRLTVRA